MNAKGSATAYQSREKNAFKTRATFDLKGARWALQLVWGIFDNDLEWDHVARLQQTLKGQPQVFQAICASCHLVSPFSKRAWDEYAVTPRPPPLVWQAHNYAQDDSVQLLEIDVRRCRMNALTNSAHEFSVFCVLTI